MAELRLQAMHRRFGTCGVLRCRGCCHLIGGEWHGKRYYKCELYGMSHSDSTDWRLSWQACGMYNVPQDMERWVPMLEQIIHGAKVVPPIDGQMGMEV